MAALLSVLLLHHIEGVCKPRSPGGRLLDQLVLKLGSRDRAAAVERATTRRAALLERYPSRRPQPVKSPRAIAPAPATPTSYYVARTKDEVQ